MRYKVAGLEIRSENSAKPMSQVSSHLRRWIKEHVSGDHVLDYGCGKLRYSPHLISAARHLTCVDSAVQVERLQRIGNVYTSVRRYAARRWPGRVRVLSTDEFETDGAMYDFALCANVLSAIPKQNTRLAVLRTLRGRLRESGRLLVASQYRNQYFRAVTAAATARPHLDGWIVRSLRGGAFYGLLDRGRLTSLVVRCGYHVVRSWTQGESAYVLATPTETL